MSSLAQVLSIEALRNSVLPQELTSMMKHRSRGGYLLLIVILKAMQRSLCTFQVLSSELKAHPVNLLLELTFPLAATAASEFGRNIAAQDHYAKGALPLAFCTDSHCLPKPLPTSLVVPPPSAQVPQSLLDMPEYLLLGLYFLIEGMKRLQHASEKSREALFAQPQALI